MKTEFSQIASDGHAMTVTLNRPERRKPDWADPS